MLKRPPKCTNSILSARASTFYFARQEGKCAKLKCKYSKISYIVNQSDWGKKYAKVKQRNQYFNLQITNALSEIIIKSCPFASYYSMNCIYCM